jgi:hypothetical protein
MNTPLFHLLINHTHHEFLSTLEVEEDVWKARVRVVNGWRREEGVFEFSMTRRCGGRYDGVWFTASLTRDGGNERELLGVM